MNPVSVALEYRRKDGDPGELSEASLLVEWKRKNYDGYIEQARGRTIVPEIYYNGNLIIKQEVYWGDIYRCNQYYWTENGYNIFVKVPVWLLDLYPEETFFEVKVVEVPGR